MSHPHATHTFAILELSPEAFQEISQKLIAANYMHAFSREEGRPIIDLTGLAITPIQPKPTHAIHNPQTEERKSPRHVAARRKGESHHTRKSRRAGKTPPRD